MFRNKGLRAVALFEAAKGLLVLVAGFGVLKFIHRDAQQVAEEIVSHFHLNPASHYPQIFLHLAERATPTHLRLLAAGAFFYALVRTVEAYGLWRNRLWAEWFAVVSAGLYVPFEVIELVRHRTWSGYVLFAVNLGIIVYLVWMLGQRRKEHHLIIASAPDRN